MIYLTSLEHISFSFLVILCFSVFFTYSDVLRPRGVSLSKASLYSPTKDFTCFDGSSTLPFSQVNDDYCDCFDGSDEPGTPACLNGVFHCTNAGHQSQNIPSSRINDGVCDCCDGTDEYASKVTCKNICEELGKEAKAAAVRTAEILKAGSRLRLELIEKGNEKRLQMVAQIAQFEIDKSEAEKIKAEKELFKNEIEAKENEALKVYREAEEKERAQKAEEEKAETQKQAEDIFHKFDSDGNRFLSKNEILTRNVFDKDKNGEVSEEEANYFLLHNEQVDLATFVSDCWPLLKPFIMLEKGIFQGEPILNEEEFADDHDEEDSQKESLEDQELDHEDEGLDADADTHDSLDLDVDHSEHRRVYDDETQKLVDEATEARRQHTDAERVIREIESNMRSVKTNLDKDYGLKHEYATLDGQCFEYEDKEYIYNLCLFQKVTQKSKNGGGEVGLGNWGEWAGSGNDQYSTMKYTNGMGCWNGPNRSTVVNVKCGLETKVLSVSEPSRCEYKMELITPCACDDSKLSQNSAHDEL